MEERAEEEGELVFEQGGVMMQANSSDRENDTLYSGTLTLRECSYAKFIEWQPVEAKAVTMDPRQNDQDWAVVNTSSVGYKVDKEADSVEFVGSSHCKVRPLRVDLDELKSFRLMKNNQQLTLMLRDGSTPSPLLFTKGNTQGFVSALQKYLSTKTSKKDRTLHLVVNKEEEALHKSLTELNLFPEASNTMWRLVENFKHPYEVTMTNFSKLLDYTFSIPQETNHRDDISELLHRSLSADHGDQIGEEGYEVIGDPKQLIQPRSPVTRSHQLMPQQWAAHVDDDGRVTDVEKLKETIFKGGITHALRKDVWKFLLGMYEYDSTTAQRSEARREKVESYYRMKLQWKSVRPKQEERFSAFRERKNLIDKDVSRTDRTYPFYEGKDNPQMQVMYDILMTYVMYNFDLGYVQGMSDLLSPILVVMQDEVDAFWCFVGIMERMGHNFEMDQASMKQQLGHLHTLIQIIDPAFCSYLEQHESGNFFFCFRWLLVHFKREFSLSDIMTLWEIMWTGLPGPNFHLICCLAVLDMEKNTLMENKYGFSEILKYINDISEKIPLVRMLETAESIYLQLRDSAADLPDPARVILGFPPHSPSSLEGGQATDLRCSPTPSPPPLLGGACSPLRKSSPRFGGGDSSVDTSSIEVLSDGEENRYEAAVSLQYL